MPNLMLNWAKGQSTNYESILEILRRNFGESGSWLKVRPQGRVTQPRGKYRVKSTLKIGHVRVKSLHTNNPKCSVFKLSALSHDQTIWKLDKKCPNSPIFGFQVFSIQMVTVPGYIVQYSDALIRIHRNYLNNIWIPDTKSLVCRWFHNTNPCSITFLLDWPQIKK